jgi:hypothetical protein
MQFAQSEGATFRHRTEPAVVQPFDYVQATRRLSWYPNNLDRLIQVEASQIPQPSARLFRTIVRSDFIRDDYSTSLLSLCRGFRAQPGYYAASVSGDANNCLFNAASLQIEG